MTPTDICNLALDVLKEAPITSIDENRPTAAWCKRNFPVTRDALLERWDWNFAIKRVSLAAEVTAPAYGWAGSFVLPPETVRVLPPSDDGTYEGDFVEHEIEDGRLLTNAVSPLNLRIVYRNENYAAYPATFIEALSARLALKCAHWITGKSNYVQIAEGMYRDAIASAWAVDAIQGSWPRGSSDEWVNSR